ncbi:HAMP domain-containing histidine kinase [Sphingomonas piscis]|uniref:histidine kinase n=1 Tax=Sphingomonas piscis TaxID=2714943 RepID=A0A6G7YLJ9_9SPHN|nr:HAMP domain-containing histidine kinase [Sphingomonas piscis]QIK77619.1 HAMP domain-containing histidine kinase [Sphingomonas piscis]
MRFDDRLATVLQHPAADDHGRAVRWRQLVELLAKAGSLGDSRLADSALETVRADAVQVDPAIRAATARAIASTPLPVELVALFARDDLAVAAPLLASATLSAEGWATVSEAASPQVRQFISALRPEVTATISAPAPKRDSEPLPSIQDVIDRIDSLRATRQKQAPAADPPRAAMPREDAPTGREAATEPALFRWECDSAGAVDWVEGAPRGALIGRPLSEPGHDRDSGAGEIAQAFAMRAPFSSAKVTLNAGHAVSGEWELSGAPVFDPTSGRFSGYRGIAKRTDSPPPAALSAPHPDSLRELVHEIKTPLNAIMGFAEIIQGQMFGPASASYRTRAAEIVSQSHLLLAAIDDLDLAARLQAGTQGDGGTVSNFGDLLATMLPSLKDKAKEQGVNLRLLIEADLPPCGVDRAVAERLVDRLVGTLIDCTAAGEELDVTASEWNGRCSLAVEKPALLRGLPDGDLLNPAFVVPRERNGRLDLGFSLRLVRGIAQLARGDLAVSRRRITLVMASGDLRPPASDRYRRQAGQGL